MSTEAEAGATRQAIRPLFDWIVVKELDPDNVRRSGVVLPDTYSEKDGPPHHAIVVAVGSGLDWWSGAGIEMPVAPGDHVVFPRAAGTYVELSEERLLALKVGHVIGVVE